MYNSISKKDLLRMYNINRAIFQKWIEEEKERIGIKNTKQTFTPKQITKIVGLFGIPPYANEEEKKYIALCMNVSV